MEEAKTIEESKRLLRRMASALARRDEDAVISILHEMVLGLEIRAVRLEPGELRLFRARILEDEEPPATVEALSYPPADEITQPHRAGMPGEQVFYASLAPELAIAEAKPDPDDRIAISTWTNTGKLVLSCIGREAGSAPEQAAADAPGNDRVLDYLFRQFAVPVPEGKEERYLLTAAVARLIGFDPRSTAQFADEHALAGGSRDEGSPFDGLLFPSMTARGQNVALRPHSVDHYLRCEGAGVYRVLTGEGAPQVRREAEAEVAEAGRLHWRAPTDDPGSSAP